MDHSQRTEEHDGTHPRDVGSWWFHLSRPAPLQLADKALGQFAAVRQFLLSQSFLVSQFSDLIADLHSAGIVFHATKFYHKSQAMLIIFIKNDFIFENPLRTILKERHGLNMSQEKYVAYVSTYTVGKVDKYGILHSRWKDSTRAYR